MDTESDVDLARCRTLAAGGTWMAGLLAAGTAGLSTAQTGPVTPPIPTTGTLPVQDIQRILRSSGRVTGPVLHVLQQRRDLNDVVGPADIPFKPAFAVYSAFHFQALPNGRAIFNGEIALRTEEINAVIDRILAAGLVFQSFHQHFFNLDPQVWHVQLRGSGSPFGLARGIEYVVQATGTPLPQTAPLNPTSTLDVPRLGRLLGGQPVIREEGIVALGISRGEQVSLGGTAVDPRLGVGHDVCLEPLADGRTAVALKLALLPPEIAPVLRALRREGFDVHSLNNQETAEAPQLTVAHLLAAGNPYYYARVIRRALQQTNTRFTA